MENKLTRPQQRVALDMILTHEGHGGMSPEALLLHEKQAEDAERMDKRMCEIEKKVDSLDRKVDCISSKMDEIKSLVEKKTSFSGSVKEVLSNKIFIYILITIVAITFGVPVAKVGSFLFGG